MPGFRLFSSNRLEVLADLLADVLRTPLASPLAQEIVIVQSKGMERWIATELACRLGIWANGLFPFPNAFLHRLFKTVLPDLPERSAFDPGIMTWKIVKCLPIHLKKPGFERVRHYVGDPPDSLRLFQLAERISDLFDQYLVFRPDMIIQWDSGGQEGWQAVLWADLVQGKQAHHRAGLARLFRQSMGEGGAQGNGFPERVSVFGISALPRFHMDILSALSGCTEVNLFLMNPCREYWGDIVSGWELKRVMDRQERQDLSVQDLHLEKGNSLLSSMGGLGRDFFDLVSECGGQEIVTFVDPGEATLLECVQSDILNIKERGGTGTDKTAVGPKDESIQIHSCHSPMREIEVLRDRLLDLFEKDPDLLPKDVVVMTPDIETYGPYIEAVFDVPGDDATRFPFGIADRGARSESQTIDVFLSLLDLCGSRFTATEVLRLLEAPVVRKRYGLSDTEIDLARRWVVDTGIRWGVNGEARRALNLPPFDENTWQGGLDRLLLGYAMPGHEESLFHGILPYDPVEGDSASTLGRFVHFCRRLFDCLESLDRPRTLTEWSRVLTGLLADFVDDDEADQDFQILHGAFRDLEEMEETWGVDQAVDFPVVRWHLGRRLERQGFGHGFIAGGLTFCAMLPMRSIPFKVLCLVGMNGDAYPRQSHPLSFDLMAKDPRPGDRSRRDDDRYLFLEAILSARQTLYISYVGQSIQDNTPQPPSVLVSELMDYVDQGFAGPQGSILEQIVIRHRLQAFSPEYFKGRDPLFSYSGKDLQAARKALNAPGAPPGPFVVTELATPPEQEWNTVDLGVLERFLVHPVRFFLNRRLGLYLEEDSTLVEDRERFALGGLDRYRLQQELVEKGLADRQTADHYAMARASGRLPHGIFGKTTYDQLCLEAAHFVEKTRPYVESAPREPVAVRLDISGFRLRGKLSGVYPKGLVRYRCAKVKPEDRIRWWLHHLVLNAIGPHTETAASYLIGWDPESKVPVWSVWHLPPVPESDALLGRLLELYGKGVNMPQHFYPRASWTYALERLERDKPAEQALRKAADVWQGSEFSPIAGEGEDAYYQLCFRGFDPLDGDFEETALSVFGPLLAAQKKASP